MGQESGDISGTWVLVYHRHGKTQGKTGAGSWFTTSTGKHRGKPEPGGGSRSSTDLAVALAAAGHCGLQSPA